VFGDIRGYGYHDGWYSRYGYSNYVCSTRALARAQHDQHNEMQTWTGFLILRSPDRCLKIGSTSCSIGLRKVARIRVGYSLIPLLWWKARIEVTIVDPTINLERETNGEWNLIRALASKSPSPSSGATAFIVNLDKLSVRQGTINLGPHGAKVRIIALMTRISRRLWESDLDDKRLK
jgi:hypothetical protein